jgi:hypothetical protein
MKYAILALGLLTNSAQAAPWTHDECDTTAQYFAYCAEGPTAFYLGPTSGKYTEKCIPADVGYHWLRPGLYKLQQHHHLPEDGFVGLCEKVCHGEVTVLNAILDATHEFCPKRPKL